VEKLVDSIDALRRVMQKGFDDMRKELVKIRRELEAANIEPININISVDKETEIDIDKIVVKFRDELNTSLIKED